jgi:hypothetical protein
MKKMTGFIALLAAAFSSFAQDADIRNLQKEALRQVKKETADTLPKNWRAGGALGISIGQGSQSNWAAGGDDFSLTVSTHVNLFSFFEKNKNTWDNTLDVNFGYVNTTSLGSRKNDDRFDFLSKYGHSINNKLRLATLLNFRSQFFDGFTYAEKEKTFTSAFLSPAYLVVSQGIDYKPAPSLSVFISPISSRWVLVKNDSLSAKGEYGVKPGDHSLNQLGSFATVHFQKSFNKHVSYRSRLDLFSNYRNNPWNIDLYMTNTLSAKVARIIAFNWSVDMIYDDDVKLFGKNNSSPALQLKSIIGVGLQVKI